MRLSTPSGNLPRRLISTRSRRSIGRATTPIDNTSISKALCRRAFRKAPCTRGAGARSELSRLSRLRSGRSAASRCSRFASIFEARAMTIHELRLGDPSPPDGPSASLAALPPRRRRLAIVSTRNKLCGIAAYTHALERQLADLFDLTVFDLDQYLLRGRHRRVRALGDRHIKDICAEIAGFDAVNLQLEFGTLGRSAKDIHRRFRWLVDASPRLSVTFHTLKRPSDFSWADFLHAIVKLKWQRAGGLRAGYARERTLSEGIAKQLRYAQ